MKKTVIVILALVLIIIFGAGCRARTEAGKARQIRLKEFSFRPGRVVVKEGAVVIWKNRDELSHTVTADDGSFNSGQLDKGQSFSQKFSRTGTLDYHCEIHPYMKATVVIK